MVKPVIRPFHQYMEQFYYKFKPYIPNAYDETWTILEKVDKLIDDMDDLGLLVNEVVELWKQIMEWVMNEGLNEAVKDRLDEMVKDGTLEKLINIDILNKKADLILVNKKTAGKVNIMEFNPHADGVTGDKVAFQKAFDLALTDEYKDGIEIYVPDGKYLWDGKLIIYRNTRLILGKNATILRGSPLTMLINGDHDDQDTPILENSFDPYSGHGNIRIEGGTFDGNIAKVPYAPTGFNMFGFCRAREIHVFDVTFKDVVTNHALDLNAIEDSSVNQCRFIGFIDATSPGHPWYPRDYAEAIQISQILDKIANVPADGTPCRNLTFRDNYFGASGTLGTQPWGVAIGAHTGAYDSYNQNITIDNNVFDTMEFVALRCFKFRATKITNNHFRFCRQDISMSNSSGNDSTTNKYNPQTGQMEQVGRPQAGESLVITGNTFENTRRIILWVRGQTKGDEITKFIGITFSDNQFIRTMTSPTTYNLIDISWCSSVILQDLFLVSGSRGVYIANSNNVTIQDGRIQNTQYEGILVTEFDNEYREKGHTFDIFILNMTIKSIPYNGILINFAKNGKIANNLLENVANLEPNVRNGIMVALRAESFEIENNKVRGGRQKFGIMVTSGTRYNRIGNNEAYGTEKGVDIVGDDNLVGTFMYSPNGSRYLMGIANDGTLTARLL